LIQIKIRLVFSSLDACCKSVAPVSTGNPQRHEAMSTKTTIALAAAVLGAALSASAKDSGPPKVDIEKTCRANTESLGTALGGEINTSFDACLADEKMAFEQITQGWAKYPALAKSICIQPGQYSPTYVEWLVCLDVTGDVIKRRTEPSGATAGDSSRATTVGSRSKGQSSNRRTRPVHKECPIVKLELDGSIASVDACPLGPPY
jgi:hypothetical protein